VHHFRLPQKRPSPHHRRLFEEHVNLLLGPVHPRVWRSVFWSLVDLFPARVHDTCMNGRRFEWIAACLVAAIAPVL
jgi:hypothetical protein